ncbi:nicotinamide riboside kinase 1-like isoform X1 [Liolophura sinensis]|uniref:nicotinamide riboside kinase 1-like isoform X1 n=1 Tax=Liolophura sinensis TaxID=3198878 RepID=UPI003158FC50
MQKAIYVVGISGISNGGKTSLAQRLIKAFPGSHYICQDTYFRERAFERNISSPSCKCSTDGFKYCAMQSLDEGSDKLVIDPELNHANWESLNALDMDQMMSDLTSHLQTKQETLTKDPSKAPHFVFVDGFTIFNYRPFQPLWSKKYFITLNREVAKERRSHRHYEPADVPGYFDKFVWPMYEKHKEELQDQHDIVYVDGTEKQDVLYERVCADLTTLAAEGQCVQVLTPNGEGEL